MSFAAHLHPIHVKVAAVALCLVTGLATRLPSTPEPQRAELTQRFAFQMTPLNADPPGARTIRPVEPSLRRIQSWISAVGAGVALDDLDADGLPNDRCLVDPRDDSVTVAVVPGSPARYAGFALDPAPLTYDARVTAPMGCVTADLNEDGAVDVLTHFWGRPPIAYLRRPGTALNAAGFRPTEVVADPSEIWNSTTANVVDLDGDGHLDLFVGNYFQDGARVLDERATAGDPIAMQDSMSNAHNAGRNRILRLTGLRPENGVAVPAYQDQSSALTDRQSTSWTLATGAQDLDRDGLPELYVANDFGPDYLLHNRSRPGRIKLTELKGDRDARIPKSKVLGDDSFKSMGVAFTDINRDTRPDLVVSNITTPYGLEESNFAFVSTGNEPLTGAAPYRDRSEELGLSRTGWAWDVKAADFDNDGQDELVQALGFVKGSSNGWALLQELAMGNDTLVHSPGSWPVFRPGTDISGDQRNPFLVRDPDSGRYVDIAADLGLSNPGPSRGIAIADTDHDGRVDAAVANQWAGSTFLHNTGPRRAYLGLRVLLPATGAATRPRPAIGATVTVTKADGTTFSQQLYPANGHTGVNSAELLFGLGEAGGPLTVTARWRDIGGQHATTTTLTPGWHELTLGAAQAGTR
jgi:hypothetical protein